VSRRRTSGPRTVAAEKLACFLAFKTDTPVSYIHDLRAEDCIFEIIEPGQLPVHG